ncbi:MAG: response regulator [Vicinamibacterales bacterium]
MSSESTAPLASALGVLLDASPDAVMLVDDEGRLLAWNNALVRATGFSAEQLRAATVDSIDTRLTLLDADEPIASTASSPDSLLRNVVTARDGRLFERVEQKMDLSPTMGGVMVWYRPVDIASESSDADRRRLRACSEQRRHALRMEAVGRLAGGIAHDFNNMLMVMIGFAEQAQVDIGRNESLAQIVRAAQRASELTRQLLAFSRQQVLRPRVVDVASVVQSMSQMVDRLIGDDVQLELDAPDGLPSVLANPSQLEQIILNLFDQRARCDAARRQLSIQVRESVLDAPRPGRAVEPTGTYVQIIVTDMGQRDRPDLQSKVFEPFFTTKGPQGTGIGLSTVYGIVKQSGGFIWIDSEVGVGTTFTIDLPVTTLAKDAAVSTTDGFVATMPQRAGGCILVVEDLEPVRLVTKEMLESDGFEVVAAASPVEALSLMETIGDRVDLVLTDVMMPEMTGSELANAIRVRRPGLPCALHVGAAQGARVERAWRVPRQAVHASHAPLPRSRAPRRLRQQRGVDKTRDVARRRSRTTAPRAHR